LSKRTEQQTDMIIDTHCHLTYPELASQIDDVVDRSIAAGVERWITVGTDKEHWRKALDLAARLPGLYVALGLHPHYASTAMTSDLDLLAALLRDGQKVRAVGETGMDLHYPDASLEDQTKVFAWHLQTAADLGLPVVVHCRDAFDQTIEQISRYRHQISAIVLHCFTGTLHQAREAMELGLYLSFSGILTFKRSGYLRKVVEELPIDHMLVETDCPYLSPEPIRKQKVNEPAFIVHTIRLMAQIKAVSPATMAEALANNAARVFGLDGLQSPQQRPV